MTSQRAPLEMARAVLIGSRVINIMRSEQSPRVRAEDTRQSIPL
jgi:hypothetical protein